MNYKKKATAILLSLMMIITMFPAMAFAEGETLDVEDFTAEDFAEEAAAEEDQYIEAEEPVFEEAEEVLFEETEDAPEPEEEISDEDTYDEEPYDETLVGYADLSFSQSIDPSELEGAEPDELMEEFFLSDTPAEDNGMAPAAPKSVKGDRLTGRSLKYYKYFRSIIKRVYRAKTSKASMKTYKKVKLKKILGKRTFTARELGVSRIGYMHNGRFEITPAAMKKINALVATSNWKKDWKNIYTSLLSDYSSESYWVDWYSNSHPKGGSYSFIDWNCQFRYTATTLTFYANDTITFRLPVIKEFRYSNSKAFKASTKKIKRAEDAKALAKKIVETFDEAIPTSFADRSDENIDINRMWFYCRVIAALNTYDDEAANYNSRRIGGPWCMISVFDNDSSTNAVCAGYARAFKYLCDLSTFRSDWIDCQIVSGKAGGEQHMWNIVRMYDGKNYLIDPTWMDNGSYDDVDVKWFLRGDPNGTANHYTVEGTYRNYDAWVKSSFAPAERKLSKDSTYQWDWDRPIVFEKPTIKKPAGGRNSITVKWEKAAPLGAQYVDGYQIRYSTKSSMSSAKTVKVKGYNKVSRTIKGLKSGKYYYVQIRTYAKMGKTIYYSPWSGKKKVRAK